MTRKVYRSKYFMHLVLSVRFEGEHKAVSLEGGMSSPRRVNGAFSTTDPKLQAAIEAHPDFRKTFELVKTINMNPAPAKKEPEEPVLKPEIYVSEAKNAQEARQELNKKYNIPFNSIKNAAAVLKQADELNIEYPNWERE